MKAMFLATDDANTLLSPEEERDLKLSLATRAELNEVERLNILTARVWAMTPKRLSNTAELGTDRFARELHKRMFGKVWKWAGKYRTTEKNLGWEAHRIPEGMRNLMDDFNAWIAYQTYPLDESVIRLHHRMVLIHPWPNGNGRHARLMADILLSAHGGGELTWGAKRDLRQQSTIRSAYIAALRDADQGNMRSLISFTKS